MIKGKSDNTGSGFRAAPGTDGCEGGRFLYRALEGAFEGGGIPKSCEVAFVLRFSGCNGRHYTFPHLAVVGEVACIGAEIEGVFCC